MTQSDAREREQSLLADRSVALWIALVMWAVAGVISLAMALQGSADWIQSVDDRAYTLVVENEVGVLVWFGQFLGTVGSVVVMGPAMIGVAVFLGTKRRWSALTIWVSAVTVSQLVSITMKNLYGRPRPPLPLMETSSFSFPSGHAITGAVFAIGLIVVLVPPARRRPSYWVIAVLYIVAMAWSRVYVRAHWLSDVTAGVAIGAAIVVSALVLIVWFDEATRVGDEVGDARSKHRDRYRHHEGTSAMSRLTTMGRGSVAVALAVANRFNPVAGDPAAPLKTVAFIDAFTPSLMPRASMHQGMAAGMSALAANIVGIGLDSAIRLVVPATAPYGARVGARAMVSLGGFALTKIPRTDDESTYVASARTAGRLAMSGGFGGIVYESAEELRSRYPASGPVRPIVIGLGSFAGALMYSSKLLHNRQAIIKRWSDDDKPASLGASIGIAAGVSTVGRLVGRAFLSSRTASQNYFGGDPLRDILGRTINTAIWAGGGAALYSAGVGYIARANETVESAYSEVPGSPFVSGGPNSISPFDELGLQGRRYVTDVMTPDVIEDTLGEPAAAHPIRAYVGYNSEPIYTTGRSEMALEELSRLGAFDRKYLLLFAPTGTGWVDQTMIESAEILSRGDIATVCIQYGRSPSFLALQKVALGRQQFRQLMWGVSQRLAERPADKRPKVLIFGESLGAWSSSDVVMHQGIKGFDDYGVDRALWFGLPGFAKWSKNGMRDGSSDLIPDGSVGTFDRIEEYNELTEDEKDAMRAVILDHDNDPIAQVSMRLAVKEPDWLRTTERGRNVPDEMRWSPLLTFIQVAVDAMNAMKVIPGEFKSFGHDYRGDTAAFVHVAYRFPPVSDEQMSNVHEALLQLEVERGERIKESKEVSAAKDASQAKRTRGPKYLRDRRLGDSPSAPIPATAGQATSDYQ